MKLYPPTLPWTLVFAAGAVLLSACNAQPDPTHTLNNMLRVQEHRVYVVAHRGDWRDAPENSLEALSDAMAIGVDAVELDLKRTQDGQLVVMHDQTLDRTTTGAGLVSSYGLSDLKKLRLRAATGHPTAHTIPTFDEELKAAKGRMVLDIDQAWDYFPEVLRLLRATGTVDQIIVNARPNATLDEFERTEGRVPDDVTLMIIVDLSRPEAAQVVDSFSRHKRTIVQWIFSHDKAIAEAPRPQPGRPIFVNSLWPELCGSHDDDRAVEGHQEADSWGWLTEHGMTIMQTDRPRDALRYFHAKGFLESDCRSCDGARPGGR